MYICIFNRVLLSQPVYVIFEKTENGLDHSILSSKNTTFIFTFMLTIWFCQQEDKKYPKNIRKISLFFGYFSDIFYPNKFNYHI